MTGFLGANNKPQPISDREAARYFGAREKTPPPPSARSASITRSATRSRCWAAPSPASTARWKSSISTREGQGLGLDLRPATPVELDFEQVELVKVRPVVKLAVARAREGAFGLRPWANARRISQAALVVIGDEILSGLTDDKNIAQVASWLQIQGIRLAEVRVVPATTRTAIVGGGERAARLRSDYLFTTGGIGPSTHDDITVDAVSAAIKVDVRVHPKARALLGSLSHDTRGGLNDARHRRPRIIEAAARVVK